MNHRDTEEHGGGTGLESQRHGGARRATENYHYLEELQGVTNVSEWRALFLKEVAVEVAVLCGPPCSSVSL